MLSCNQKNYRYISDDAHHMLLTKFPQLKGFDWTIYYMDGGCSFCIAKAITIDNDVKKNKNMKAIFVSVSDNSVLVEYYFKQNKIDGFLISGKDSILKNSNIMFNEVVVVHSDKSISSVSEYN